MHFQRNYVTGEFVLAAVQILDTKGNVFLEPGEGACLMAFDPTKGDTPNGIRKSSSSVVTVWVSEAQLAKDPSKAHLTPKRDPWL